MRINRRQFLQTTSAAGFTLAAGLLPAWGDWSGQIDRRALIRRHNPLATQFDPFAALTVGNGEFAFTADVTGLQTFSAECEKQFPLCTTSHWAWHSTPLSAGLDPKTFRYQDFDTYGRPVGYATDSTGQELLFNWLRENPHRFHLGQIGFALKKSDGSPAVPGDLKNIHQTLDLWNGLLESYFEFEGRPVQVQTCCHPELDLIAAHIESPLLADGRLLVRLAFPCASPAMSMADWGHPERHTTTLSRPTRNRANFARKLDSTEYAVSLQWKDGAELVQRAEHEFLLNAKTGEAVEFVCHFSPKPFPEKLPGVAQTQSAAEKHWRQFWNDGGAIDLSGSTDPRAPELERRIVLSLYNTALHCTGALPSAETGLLCNSWFGKFHLEMHWWHSVHFTAWNRFKLFEQSLAIYERILPLARDTARRQGYRGARWPKMIGPDGHDSPSSIGPLLIWQQPHPIYYAELSYRQRPDKQTLARWREIVFESAEFMVMEVEDTRFGENGVLFMADCGVIPEPTADQLADIALSTAQLARQMLGRGRAWPCCRFQPRAAPTMRSPAKCRRPRPWPEQGAERGIEADFDGELQVDAALVPEIAERKLQESKVAGRANVLIFPDLNSGNIASKLMRLVGRANAYGHILLGLNRPAADVSRGSNAHDILGVAAIVGVQATDYQKLYPGADAQLPGE